MATPCPSTSSAPNHHHFLVAELAIQHLTTGRRLTRLIPHFTPESTIQTLLLTQSDRRLFLSFLSWAPRRLPFFRSSLPVQSLSFLLHCRYRLSHSALALSRHLAVSFPLPSIFDCLSSSLSLFKPPLPSLSLAVDLLIKSYSSLNNLSDALLALSLVKGAGFVPSLFAYNSILDCMFRSGLSIDEVDSFVAQMTQSGVSLNVYSYNILIRGYCERGELECAVRFMDEMERTDCAPNVVTFNTLIHWYCQSGKIGEAFKLFGRMGAITRPNLVSYNLLISGLCKKGKMNDARKMLVKMREQGLSPDIFSYNTLVSGYCKTGHIHQAQMWLRKMTLQGISPNSVSYTSFINAMCKAGKFTQALEVVTEMCKRRLTLNEVTITTIANGFCKKGFRDDALLALNEVKKSGIEPSLVCYTALINGYCILGHINEALKIVRDMEEKGIRADVVTYSIIMVAYCKRGDLDKAFDLRKEMLQKNIKPDNVMYSSLVVAFCKAGKLHYARKVFYEMLESGLQLDEMTYRSIINDHCRYGDLKSTLLLHGKVIKKGAIPDEVAHNVLIKSLGKLTRVKQVERALNKEVENVLNKAQNKKLMHDNPNYNVIIEHCTKARFESVLSVLKGFCMNGLMDDADKVFQIMLGRNWKPDASVYRMLINGHWSNRNVGKALRLYNEMVRDGFMPINNESCFADKVFI